jgi:hypothetical protein
MRLVTCKTIDSLGGGAPIWRYMSLGKFISLMQSSSLFLAPIAAFEDDHEGTPNDPEEQVLSKRFVFVSCWHASNHESNTMWKTYVPSGEGICLRTTIKGLIDAISLKNNKELSCILSAVSYDGQAPAFDARLARFFTKRPYFSSEREVRLLLDMRGNLKSNPTDVEKAALFDLMAMKGYLLPVNLKVLIDEVIVAPNSGYMVKVVCELMKDFGFGEIMIYESQISAPIPFGSK